MICLGIESSCDETAAAIVEDGRLLSAALASQANLHAIFGGVVPELASREHLRFIGPLFDEALRQAGIPASRLDCIAVTRGPGLLGSLLAGMAFAKGLALGLQIPLIGVNHLQAHLLACGLDHDLVFPGLGLVVSGGHTELYRMESPLAFTRLGRTLDDAAGEVFDKTGHALGLDYPAGAAMDKLASSTEDLAGRFPRPYLANENLDFSFSGLKTAAINAWNERKQTEGKDALPPFCRAINQAVADTLAAKTERALKRNPDLKVLYLAGGVAANSMIRQKLQTLMAKTGGILLSPPLPLCADNAAMIAYTGWLHASNGICHQLDLEAIPRGRKIPDDYCQRLKQP